MQLAVGDDCCCSLLQLAGLQMHFQIHSTSRACTLAAPQLPSNLLMVRVGLRAWLGFLLAAWGAVAACFMFITTPTSFYILRLLLGIFEAGAFPGMWYALATFYPRNR